MIKKTFVLFLLLIIACTPKVKDCGSTDDPFIQGLTTSSVDYESDAAIACLGNSLIKCEKANLHGENEMLAVDIEVLGEVNGVCSLKITYGDQIATEGLKKYANTYLVCPVDLDQILAAYENPEQKAGEIATGAYVLSLMSASINPETECTGTFMEQ